MTRMDQSLGPGAKGNNATPTEDPLLGAPGKDVSKPQLSNGRAIIRAQEIRIQERILKATGEERSLSIKDRGMNNSEFPIRN